MHKPIIIICAAAGLGACGQSANDGANQDAANSVAAEAPKPAYCFFKDSETKAWKAKVEKDGNVTVSGKAYREDSLDALNASEQRQERGRVGDHERDRHDRDDREERYRAASGAQRGRMAFHASR